MLVAISRVPRTRIEKTKIKAERGFVEVDGYMRTAEAVPSATSWPDIRSLRIREMGIAVHIAARRTTSCVFRGNVLPS